MKARYKIRNLPLSPLLGSRINCDHADRRRFWQLRMGEPAFLGRPWLAGPPGASLRLIRDYVEIKQLVATIDVVRRPSK
jgi:hypothetical protein